MILDWLYNVIISVSLIISGASIIATLTPSKKDDEWIGKLYNLIDAVTIRVGRRCLWIVTGKLK